MPTAIAVLALLVTVAAPVEVWLQVGAVSRARTSTALSVFSVSVLLMASALWRHRLNLAGTREKLRHLLGEYPFAPARDLVEANS
mgnify:CR=1 FL=1